MMRLAIILAALSAPAAAFAVDADGDGFDSVRDCDDTSATTYPGAPEPCDGVDNDCDGIADNGCGGDVDGDGYTTAQGDCDDTNPAVSPSAQEVCDRRNVDEDCDGLADDGDPSVIGLITYYADGDGDGFGDPGATNDSCDPTFLFGVTSGTDCNDGDDTTFPNAPEACDGVDNDCDGVVDDGCGSGDNDGDGYTTAQGDCNDNDPRVNPAQPEVVGDGIDSDCDGVEICYVDDDDDGVAAEPLDTVTSRDRD